jgi:hypothetical protein
MTVDPQKAPDVPTVLVITFQKGKFILLIYIEDNVYYRNYLDVSSELF